MECCPLPDLQNVVLLGFRLQDSMRKLRSTVLRSILRRSASALLRSVRRSDCCVCSSSGARCDGDCD
jgi:hypothetical protein